MAVIDQSQKGGSGGKWLFGCCGGCLGLVVVIAVVVGIVAYFLLRSHPVLPPETFLTASADAFLVGAIKPDDKAVIALIQASARQQGQQVPKAEEVAERLESLTPIQMVVLARHTEEEGEFDLGGVGSIKPWSGLVRLLVKAIINDFPDQGGSVQEYKGVTIGTSSGGICLAAKDNNFMFAQSAEMIKEWLDRIEEAGEVEEGATASYEGPVPMKEMYRQLDPTAQVRLVSSNEHGEVRAFLDWLKEAREKPAGPEEREPALVDQIAAAEIDWSNVTVVGGTLHIIDPDTAGMDLLIQCASEEFAEGLHGAAMEWIEQQPEEDRPEDAEVTVEGTLLKVTVKLSGLQQAVQEASQQAGQWQPPAPPEPAGELDPAPDEEAEPEAEPAEEQEEVESFF